MLSGAWRAIPIPNPEPCDVRCSVAQSFNAARVSPADARDAARARSLSAERLFEAPVAPRMNSTAQAAHIAQMPNITSHFSISPVLRNPVSFFCACREAAYHYACLTARRVI
jgi:hypothetical protein